MAIRTGLDSTMLHYRAVWKAMVSVHRPLQLKIMLTQRGGWHPLFQAPIDKECTYCYSSLVPSPTQLSIISSIFHSRGESLEKRLHLYYWEMEINHM